MEKQFIKAEFSGSTRTDGYGEHPLITIFRPMPKWKNNGYNIYSDPSFQAIELDEPIPAGLGQNTEEDRLRFGFVGWVWAIFQNGEDKIFVSPHGKSWDNEKKEFTGAFYNVHG